MNLKKVSKVLTTGFLIGSLLTISSGGEEVSAANNLNDIPKDSSTEINYLLDKGVVTGFTDGTFRPDVQVTRGQFALLVSRALEIPMPSSKPKFSDVSSSQATYQGVMKAYSLGIIKGYENGQFKPTDLIKRSDIAIMLDRALQTEGNFTTKATLDYKDTNKIGATSLDAIKRLTHYRIINANNLFNEFQPEVKGTRETTAVEIYNLLKLIEDPDQVKDNYKYMTPEELKETYGEFTVVERATGLQSNLGIRKRDFMEEYYHKLRGPFGKYQLDPKTYLKGLYEGAITSYAGYYNNYPKYEMISLNGKSYRQSEIFQDNKYSPTYMLKDILPEQPEGKEDFLIDLHTDSDEFATYERDDISVNKLGKKPVSLNGDYIVDLNNLFRETSNVSMSNKQITYNRKTIAFSDNSNVVTLNGDRKILKNKITIENNTVYGPLKEVAKYLGMDVRQSVPYPRIEVTSYPTDIEEYVWKE